MFFTLRIIYLKSYRSDIIFHSINPKHDSLFIYNKALRYKYLIKVSLRVSMYNFTKDCLPVHIDIIIYTSASS